jgi:hypothetical protein
MMIPWAGLAVWWVEAASAEEVERPAVSAADCEATHQPQKAGSKASLLQWKASRSRPSGTL